MSRHYWGIDLGGTKIEGVILPSTTTPDPLCRIRLDTEADKGYDHVVGRICLLVEQMHQESGLRPEAIGMGTPGMLDTRTHTVKNSNTTCLIGRPLQHDLEKILNTSFTLAAAAAWSSARRHYTAVRASPASGATTSWIRTVRTATAAERDAWRPFCQALSWKSTTPQWRALP